MSALNSALIGLCVVIVLNESWKVLAKFMIERAARKRIRLAEKYYENLKNTVEGYKKHVEFLRNQANEIEKLMQNGEVEEKLRTLRSLIEHEKRELNVRESEKEKRTR